MYHSQSGQDSYLDQQVFRRYRNGVFVEVGAWDGVDLSNTVFFERERNWTGLAIEPLPDRYAHLVQQRTCKALNIAINETEGETEFMCLSGPTSMLSGIVSNYDFRHIKRIDAEVADLSATKTVIKVPTRRLETVFEENNLTRIHYLSIDVEGSELACIKSIDFSKVYIDVIGFENNYADKTIEIINYLKERGYKDLDHKSEDYLMIHSKSPFAVILKPLPFLRNRR